MGFNVIGIALFYPVPQMRIPIPLARKLGDLTAEYRWFAGFYLVFMFFLVPALVFLLSLAGTAALYMVMCPLLLLLLCVGVVNVLQNTRPRALPPKLRNWEFLPLWMRSLEPMDQLIGRLGLCKKCRNPDDTISRELPIIKPIQAPTNTHLTPTLINGRLVANFSASELESLVAGKDESPDRLPSPGQDSHVITICKDLHTIQEKQDNNNSGI